MAPSYFLIFSWIFLVLIALSIWWFVGRKSSKKQSNVHFETDLRLTYKRFKEIYPYSRLTYQEYKKLQGQKAYKRNVSSQEIKRMVR